MKIAVLLVGAAGFTIGFFEETKIISYLLLYFPAGWGMGSAFYDITHP